MNVDHWQHELDELAARGRLRSLRTMEALAGHRVRMGDRCYLNLASNDYLGLGCDQALHQAFLKSIEGHDALGEMGFTASASRLLGGNHPAYGVMEERLESAYGHGKRALVFNSGYHANIGILPALAERGDLILSDRLNHASLLDGIRLSRAEWVRYRHRDVEHLRDLLVKRRATARRVFIVTESIFSMDGDSAVLKELVALKREFDAVLYVDEAHAAGVRGARGLGLCEEGGVLGDVDILVGTFGKALASVGAYVVTHPVVRDYLVNTMRSLIFTTALPPVSVSWSGYVFERVLEGGELRARLAANTALFRAELARRGAIAPGDSHIVPVILGEDKAAAELSDRLKERGYLSPPIRPPTVAEGTARLRFSLGAQMQAADLLALAELVAGGGAG